MILSNKTKIEIFLVIFLLLIVCIAYSEKEAPPEYWKSFVVNIYFDGKKIFLDKDNFPQPIMPTVLPYENVKAEYGDYIVRILDVKNNILFETKFKPKIGQSIIYLPYFLTLEKIQFISPLGIQTEYSLKEIRICNENGVCETGEENLCPLDCKSAVNPEYPQNPSIITQIKSRQKPIQFSTTTPRKIYTKLVIYSILFIFIVFLIFSIIYRKKL